MQSKNVKQSRIHRLFGIKVKSKLAAAYMDTAVKILICVVCGALFLTGIYGVIQKVVLPKTESSVTSMFAYESADADNGGGAGGSGGVETPDVGEEDEMIDIPVFVNSIEECTDTSKKYVLPDGYLYEYLPESVANFTNLASNFENGRFNSVGELTTTNATNATACVDYIPFLKGTVVRIKGFGSLTNYYSPVYNSAYTCNSATYANKQTGYITYSYDSLSGIVTLESTSSAVSQLRVSGVLTGTTDDVIITVNEEIKYSTADSFAWQKTEQYVPEDWHSEVMTVSENVNNITSDSSVAQFLLASDLHYPTSSNIQNIGKVSAEIMRDCNIPFFMNVGDNVSNDSSCSLSDQVQQFDHVINNILAPIPQKNILLTVGNHDGATGCKDVNGESVYYRYQLNNEERANVFFEWQKSSNKYKKFGPDGTYYYIDDANTKTRYIMLNSFWTEWAGEEDGFTTDVWNSFFDKPLFGQEQLSWFANEALNMPSGYSAVIGTHSVNPSRTTARDMDVFSGIISAYKNKTTYSGSHTDKYDWQASSISVDYSSAKGDIIAIFTGHDHEDQTIEGFAVPVICITTAGAEARDENAPDRVTGTATETAIDVVTIDKNSKKIYLTRLGVGEDRVVNY